MVLRYHRRSFHLLSIRYWYRLCPIFPRYCSGHLSLIHIFVYQIERLPLLSATAIHAGALYLDYLLIYLLNNWIPRDWAFIGVFTLCFAVGYALIWGIILLSIRHRTNRINRHLRGGK